MKMTLCAGACALATLGLLSTVPAASANELSYAPAEQSRSATPINIGRIRSVLRLTPQQEPLWGPVEAALHAIVRQQQAQTEPAGFVRRVSHRVVSIVLNSAAIERLASAARPLIAALDNEQKRAAHGLAQEMGLGAVVMAALR